MSTPTHAGPPAGIPPAGFRLPPKTRPGRVRLQVQDAERSIEFYERVLGLRSTVNADGSVRLGAAPGEDPLIELVERPGARRVPSGGRLGLYHVAYLLPDRPSLGRFVRHVSALGVRLGMADHLVSEAVYLSDPDGLGIEVYADRPRRSWVVRGSEYAMATDPLDVQDLVRTSGDAPWHGAPPETSVGHVHLHVADLKLAERFYHAALGLDKIVWSYPGALFMSAGGYHHHLGTNTWAAGAALPTDEDARLLEWSLEVPTPGDVAAVADSLSAEGFGPVLQGDSLLVTDPWRTTLRVFPEDGENGRTTAAS